MWFMLSSLLLTAGYVLVAVGFDQLLECISSPSTEEEIPQ